MDTVIFIGQKEKKMELNIELWYKNLEQVPLWWGSDMEEPQSVRTKSSDSDVTTAQPPPQVECQGEDCPFSHTLSSFWFIVVLWP